jgi:hypothetical protein
VREIRLLSLSSRVVSERVRNGCGFASRIAYRISHRGPSVRRSRCRRRDDARRRRETAVVVAASVGKIKSLRRRFRSPASVAWRKARGRGRAPRAGNNPRTRTRTRAIARTATAGRAKRWGTERSGAPEGDENPRWRVLRLGRGSTVGGRTGDDRRRAGDADGRAGGPSWSRTTRGEGEEETKLERVDWEGE